MTNLYTFILLFNAIFPFASQIETYLRAERALLSGPDIPPGPQYSDDRGQNNSKDKKLTAPVKAASRVEENSGNTTISNITSKSLPKQEIPNKLLLNPSHDISNEKNAPKTQSSAKKSNHTWNGQEQESGFLLNVMMVLLVISLLFLVFVAYKTYRRKSRNARIKKYGVRLTRGNIEMTPLPLDNDDEDEIVFDLKNVPT